LLFYAGLLKFETGKRESKTAEVSEYTGAFSAQ